MVNRQHYKQKVLASSVDSYFVVLINQSINQSIYLLLLNSFFYRDAALLYRTAKMYEHAKSTIGYLRNSWASCYVVDSVYVNHVNAYQLLVGL